MFGFLVGVAVVLACTIAQDLQFECILCADKFDKCELDCAWSMQDYNASFTTDCLQECSAKNSECVDTDEALDCFTCTMACSETYDSDMRRCLSAISRDTKATYGSSLSECQLVASDDMDTCMAACDPRSASYTSASAGDDGTHYTPG
jgi:hypothetical protein